MMEAQTEKSPQLLTAKIYDAALKGNVSSLINLFKEEPLILDRCIIEKSNDYKQSPLHVAANLGHSEFSKEILRLKPELAEELDQPKRWSPLHIASAKGHLEIVNTLLAVNPDMCFARDQEGKNPIHVAAIKGQVQVLEVLLQAKQQAGRERTNDGETVLHLCVKHGRLESLEFLVRTMGDGQLLNSKDRDGNTILHLAVASLLNLFHIDPFILDRCTIERSGCFVQSPLHIAAKLGHLEFTKEILRRKPELAEELDYLKRWSPLHMASAKGYLEIAKALLEVNSNMCFTRDQDGRNPFHIAAINGNIHVLDELFQAKPWAAMEQTSDGETVLHLCVKHSQPDALIFLVNVTDDGELLNSKDRNGNTVLHLAVSAKQPCIHSYFLLLCNKILATWTEQICFKLE